MSSLKNKEKKVFHLLFSKHILSKKNLLWEDKGRTKKKKMQKRTLVYRIHCPCSFFPLVYRVLTDITWLNCTVQPLSKAGSETMYKTKNTACNLIIVENHYINVACGRTGLHSITQKIYATALCLEQTLSTQNTLLYGCILLLAFDLLRHLESKT